jgi:uncharacterized cupredoxin-like copper-binding protein
MSSPLQRRPALIGALVLVATTLLTGCAPDPTTASPVSVGLFNDGITLDVSSVAAGPVTLNTANESTDLVHEIEVFAGAQAGAVLPTDNGVADVTGLTLVDEVEDILPGSTASVTVSLQPGTYLVMCNLPTHYGSGMWAYLTVTG